MKFKKTLIASAVVVGALVLYAIIGFYILPNIVRTKAPALITEYTGQSAKLDAVEFNPFTLKIDLRGFMLSVAGGKPLLSFESLSVDVDAFESLRLKGIVLDSVVLQKPDGTVERRSDGTFNFNDLYGKKPQAEQQKPDEEGNALPLLIHQLALDNGQLLWLDAKGGQQMTETAMPINLSASELSLREDGKSTIALNLQLASGGKLDLSGDLKLTSFASNGHIKLDELALPKVWQLVLQESMPVTLSGGRLSLQADYQMSSSEAGISLMLNNAQVDIQQLELTEKSQPTRLFAIPAFAVHGINLDLGKQQVNIASLTSSDADIAAWLQPDGQLNYQTLFAQDSATATSAAPAPTDTTAKPWQIKLDELVLTNYQIRFTDNTQKKPVELVLSEMNCKLLQLNNTEAANLPVDFSTRINKTGLFKLNGDFTLRPFSANWTVELSDIKLKTFQPYVDPYLNIELVDGDVNSRGYLKLNIAEEMQINFQGDANVESLITRDKVKNKDFVKWANLELKQLAVDVQKQDFKIGKVIFDRPYVRFNIKKDGKTNVDDIILSQIETKPTTQPAMKSNAEKSAPEPSISIGKIEMKNGQSDFADYSLILPFVAEMNGLVGEVNGFSSNTDNAAKLQLQGKVYDLATVAIKGSYQFQSGDSDIDLSFKHMPLPLVTPYMAEFAGYKIEKGQMALDLRYNIKKGRLTANNKILIDQLTLGEHVENPKAVSLPLHLAIALLKDADGKISLDFPISGSLEDPKFSVGSLIADVFVNLISKAVTSPFRAIASMLGSDEDLSTVTFAAGSSELGADEIAKLDQIGKALNGKPELVLEVKGVAYQIQDWPVMRFEALKDILKKMKSGELRDKGEKILSEYIELSDDEYKRLLAKFYAEVFPKEIDFSLFGKPRIKNKPDVDFYTEARQQLEAIMQPEPQRLNDLAVARANAIAKHMAERAGIDRSRIYILATELNTVDAESGIHAVLSLNVGT